MSTLEIFMYAMAVVCLVVGLLLSNNGTPGGLSSLSGQDLEIFKKSKDRGFIKILQIIMFILMFVFVTVSIILRLS